MSHYPDDFRGYLPGERRTASDFDELDNELIEDADEWEKFEAAREEYRAKCKAIMTRMNAKSALCLAKYLDGDDDNAHDEVNDQIADCMAHADFMDEVTA